MPRSFRRARAVLAPLCLAAVLPACGSSSTPDRRASPSLPQFDSLPDESEGLTNVGADLNAVLENGDLTGACERYRAGATDRKTKLLCGKWMYFYESYSTAGVPAGLVDFELTELSEDVGPGFSAYGMIPDPTSEKHYPLGLAPTDSFGALPALAFTCASCHFGKLPDGRYAVGAPNHSYEYGKHILALLLPPFLGLGITGDHDEAALASVQPMVDHILADSTKGAALQAAITDLTTGLSGSGVDPTAFGLSKADEAEYAAWKSGTMDFLIAPLPAKDDVLTISKISPLWELPRADEMKATHMRHAMLGWTGGTASLMNFLKAFVLFGGGKPDLWPEEKLEPLAEYIYSLRRPENPEPPPAADVERGAELFGSAGCNECHQGPRGSGLDLFRYEDVGTDDAMKRWFDADLDGTGCCGGSLGTGDELTHELKSPRLVGLWTMKRYLHNGSVDSLEDLFCLNGARPTVETPAYSDRGHDYTCDDALSASDRKALIAFLKAE
ncbi:MAG TPA: hypothetical protein VHE30_20280 [Polyangiaceae bacterium]|nr:hypothetical protein [Polyangiaceae bacterium]